MWTAFLGLHDQSKRNAPGVQERGLQRIIKHPFFNDFTFDYDIALLQLDRPVEYSATIRPICLPAADHTFPAGKAIWVTGWGHTQEAGEWGPRVCSQPHCCRIWGLRGCPSVPSFPTRLPRIAPLPRLPPPPSHGQDTLTTVSGCAASHLAPQALDPGPASAAWLGKLPMSALSPPQAREL